MSHPRVRTNHRIDEPMPANIGPDHHWVHHHQHELREQYGEHYIIVYQEKVYGVGDTYEDALNDAERNLPPEISEIVVVVESLHQRHPFLRARLSPSKMTESKPS